ncbi:MAG TPA: aldo/keto reductase, partial [Microbacteriaceae bacterium]|nr:aldo/keto reductase [Microbacteriaceae bacterium]
KPRDEYLLSTKVGRLLRPDPAGRGRLDTEHDFWVDAGTKRVWDFTAAGLRRSLEESLTRLGVDRVDTVFLHDPEKYDLGLADREAYPALAAMRDEGLVGRVGVGSMSVEALARAARHSELDVMMIAGRLTLAEQPVLPEVLESARRHGLGVVAAGVFNSGLLSHAAPRADSRYEYGATPAALLAHVRQIAAVCEEHGVDLPTAALQYPMTIDVVESVVVGGSRPRHVLQNVARMSAPVPPGLWSDLRERGLIA